MDSKTDVGKLQAEERRFAIILGAGAAGIIQGCTFLREDVLPLEEFHILDRNESFGGVWWSNTYPGAACDIPSNEYCISWALNPYWSRTYAPQAEIQQYFEEVALKYQLDKSTTFNTEILSATWDDSRLLWFIRTQDSKSGAQKIWCCNVLVSAAGAFGMPKKADIAGLETFKGEQWHLGCWPKDADLKNKSVAVIGTGPSAGQAIPSIYPEVKHLTVYQRSPGHCLPRNDIPISGFRKWVFAHIPLVQRSYRWLGMAQFGFLSKRIFHIESWWQKLVVGMTRNHLYNQISDDNLRRKLESKDHFGCKRPLKLDNWYPLFTNANVDLVTDPVTGLTEDGILSKEAEGEREIERKADVLIWGTGYNSNKFGTPVPTRGRTGKLLAEKYEPDLLSLYGVAVDDFPNYFNFLGPNSSSFETNVMELFEWQAHHTCLMTKLLFHKIDGSGLYAVMPKEERVREWTLSLRPGQAKLPPADPTCKSYYKSAAGHVYRFPYPYWKYKALIAKIDLKRDWVLLRKALGQEGVEVHDFSNGGDW